jgi:hypothetical protein
MMCIFLPSDCFIKNVILSEAHKQQTLISYSSGGREIQDQSVTTLIVFGKLWSEETWIFTYHMERIQA